GGLRFLRARGSLLMTRAAGIGEAPAWVGLALVPLVNLLAALVVSGIVVFAVGQSPLEALQVLVFGAFGYGEAIGYTLYYTTNFIFTGLAVAVAFHAGLFNIGGEGQAYLGGLGVSFACLALDTVLPFPLMLIVVITTIMFNFIASALMTYLMVYVLIVPGQQSPESRAFHVSTHLPTAKELF